MHLPFLPICSSCYKDCEAEGRDGRLEKLKCPRCLKELRGSEAREFQKEAIQHYTEGLEKREQFRNNGFPFMFPDEISIFQMEFKGSKDRGFHTVYGYLLEE